MISTVKRLHITPLTPELLPVILGSHLLQIAQNISYHKVETAPENSYGYVDLPNMNAEKVKKKLNGAILKGKKIKIEDAKPRKRKHQEADSNAEPTLTKTGSPTPKREKKARETKNVLSGHELSPDRKVKRGWTLETKNKPGKKDKSRSNQQKPKYTERDELLFRTTVPPNRSDAVPDRPKRGKTNSDTKVIHEFEKSTTQPSFLKQSGDSIQRNLEYVDGEGWVDENGTVVEPEPSNVKARRKDTEAKATRTESQGQTSKVNNAIKPTSLVHSTDEQQPTPEDEDVSNSEEGGAETFSSSSTPSTPPLAEEASPEEQTQSEVHPLEALFKKPKKPASSQDIAKPSLELATSNFSFFDGDAGNDIDEDLSVPGTPYSSQDLRSRGLRSAAPTPDTAHPSRFSSYGSSVLPGDEDQDDSEGEDDAQREASNRSKTLSQNLRRGEPSEFEKMFWENRGENNRAWKARRRTVLKEKRQRENRARRPKNW